MHPQAHSGGSKKMVIFTMIGTGRGEAVSITMIFRRDFDESITL